MGKLLCIVGPTATGKTALALHLAAKEPSTLISADSRQVYRGMDIVTGKDHPTNTQLFGIDLVAPDESCSVSVWYNAVMPIITQSWEEGRLPIVVGGTGFYVHALTHGIHTLSVPINQELRSQLTTLSLPKLQAKLCAVSPAHFLAMNHSDQSNPRRLIRAIEVALSSSLSPTVNLSLPQTQLIGLRYSSLTLQKEAIRARVLSRLQTGAVRETKKLLQKYPANFPSLTAIGYRSLIAHLTGKLSQAELIEHWVADELAYAKRQLTWFRRDKSIQWYDIDKEDYDYPKN